MSETQERRPEEDPRQARERTIVRTSLVGILTNVLLAAFKAAAGILSRSIAIVLDAVNNLSDALSSVITIIGAKLAGRAPDREHPLGHGRIEYLSSMIVSAIVLYAGITALIESVKKILHPDVPDYSALTLVILVVAIVTKLLLGRYVKKQGEKVNSGALIASGSDASFDAILSASVLASAVLFLLTGISLEAWVGVLISVMIIRAGIGMIRETLDDILGHRADPELSREIKRLLNEEPEIRGAYDLMINNYGPGKDYASVHIELPDTMTVEEVDRLTRRIEARVYCETGVVLTGVGVYSYNTGEGEETRIRNEVQHMVMQHDWVLQCHGFYVNLEEKTMRMDAVLSFDRKPDEAVRELTEEVQAAYPDFAVTIVPDVDITD